MHLGGAGSHSAEEGRIWAEPGKVEVPTGEFHKTKCFGKRAILSEVPRGIFGSGSEKVLSATSTQGLSRVPCPVPGSRVDMEPRDRRSIILLPMQPTETTRERLQMCK